jgi:hypothetical protein
MKKFLAAIAFLAAVPSVLHAQAPVLRQVEISLTRERIPNTGSAALVVRYILIDPGNAVPARDGFEPLERVAVLLLFVGGDGTLNLTANQVNTGSPNFLARNRNHFAAEGFVVAVVDAASDFNQHDHSLTTEPDGSVHGGGLRGHRLPVRQHGEKHLADLIVVMNDLRTKYPGLPLWAVGTSRGTVSAAVTATPWVPEPADGLVLTSTLTGPDASEDMSGLPLELVKAPVLIVTHRDDACPITRPEDSEALKASFTSSPRVRVMRLNGGSTPISLPCDALAPHGFFGIDQKAVEAITRWIRRRED